MIRSLWIAQSGLEAQQFNVDVISNNLANVCTNGFKRQRAVFQDLLYQTLRQPGAQSSQHDAVSHGPAAGNGRGARGDRTHLHAGQPAAGGRAA